MSNILFILSNSLLKIGMGWLGWHIAGWLGADLWLQVAVTVIFVSDTYINRK